MTDIKTPPATVKNFPISHIDCDLTTGPIRCTVQLAIGNTTPEIKAIWRNETGPADVTGLQVSS